MKQICQREIYRSCGLTAATFTELATAYTPSACTKQSQAAVRDYGTRPLTKIGTSQIAFLQVRCLKARCVREAISKELLKLASWRVPKQSCDNCNGLTLVRRARRTLLCSTIKEPTQEDRRSELLSFRVRAQAVDRRTKCLTDQ